MNGALRDASKWSFLLLRRLYTHGKYQKSHDGPDLSGPGDFLLETWIEWKLATSSIALSRWELEHTDHKRSKHQNATSNTTTRTKRIAGIRPAGRPAGRPAYIIKAGRPSSVFHILEIYYKEGSIRANAYALETRLIASSTLIQTTLLWWGTSQFVTYFEIWPPEGSKRNLRLGAGFFLGAPFNSATYYAKISKSLKKPGTARGLVRCELSICVVCYCNDKILCRDSFGFCSNKLKNYVFKITNSSAKIDYRTQLKC